MTASKPSRDFEQDLAVSVWRELLVPCIRNSRISILNVPRRRIQHFRALYSVKPSHLQRMVSKSRCITLMLKRRIGGAGCLSALERCSIAMYWPYEEWPPLLWLTPILVRNGNGEQSRSFKDSKPSPRHGRQGSK